MPRFVRPAWIQAGADGRRSDVGLGPTARGGFAWARVTLRTAAGSVSEPIRFDAGGTIAGGSSSEGAARFVLDIPASFVVSVSQDASGAHVIAYPADDR